MVERLEDLNLPHAGVARIIKDALPEEANISKEASLAIARAASEFVRNLTFTTKSLANKENHKTIREENFLEALKQMKFDNFIEPLKKDLETYRKAAKVKKEGKVKKHGIKIKNDEKENTAA